MLPATASARVGVCDNRYVSAVTQSVLARYRALRVIVDRVELELRRIDLWEDAPPTSDALTSREPFSYDTLMFHQWLQWQFIPRMRRILAGHGALPSTSAILPYAQDSMQRYRERDVSELLFLIGSFDELISEGRIKACH